MTILGDFNQAVFSHTPVHHNMAELSSLYGKEQTELVELKRSYRSTFLDHRIHPSPGGKQRSHRAL